MTTLQEKIAHKIMQVKPDSILLKPNVLSWLYNTGVPKDEHFWGQSLIPSKSKQWTTAVSEQILFETLEILNENPARISNPVKSVNSGKRLVPDFISDSGIYECKSRTYSTTGTAGEKILGTPLKYIEIPKIYKKPLYIICMAYQEIEARYHFNLFHPKDDLKDILNQYKNTYNIHFVPFTQLLEKIIT